MARVVAQAGRIDDGCQQIFWKAQRQDGQRRRLEQEHHHPGKEEGHDRTGELVQRSERFQKIHVLAARFRDQSPDLAVGHGPYSAQIVAFKCDRLMLKLKNEMAFNLIAVNSIQWSLETYFLSAPRKLQGKKWTKLVERIQWESDSFKCDRR